MTGYVGHMTDTGTSPEDVARRVRDAAHTAHVSIVALADATGISEKTLRRRIGPDPSQFKVDELVRIAAALNRDWSYFACGIEVVPV